MIRGGGKPPFPRWVWGVLIAIALLVGIGTGVFFGLRYNRAQTVVEKTVEPEVAPVNQEVVANLAQATEAIEKGDWKSARGFYQQVLLADPNNAEAKASIPLIERHLKEAKGSLLIRTEPTGAEVRVPGQAAVTSPATLENLPSGPLKVEISLEGFESIVKEIEVVANERTELPPVTLSKSTGKLEVVSEPKGVEFKILKADENDEPKELVQIGKTPAMIPELDPGEYKVLMAVEGWPEYSELVRVRHNQNASVSAVFSRGGLNITSEPPGAEVWVQKGDGPAHKSGATPLTLDDLPIGKHRIELRYRDWSPIKRTVEVADSITQNLDFSWQPAPVRFVSDPPGAEVFLNDRRVGNGRTPFTAELPAGDYVFSANHRQLGRINSAFSVNPDAESNEVNFGFSYGSVRITSEPSGAAVVANGKPLGRTPLFLANVAPGQYRYELSKENYTGSSVSGEVKAGGSLEFSTTLEMDGKPDMNGNFINGLGERLTWFGSLNGWVAANEVTQELYERVMGDNPSSFKAPKHPVDSVTWYQAAQYAEKLTIIERGLGNVPEGYVYRLPTDKEWGAYVGKQGLDEAITSLGQRLQSSYPVGSMPPNEFGLSDVRGNVWEWCTDWYSQTIVSRIREAGGSANPQFVGTERKVLRGGAWNKSNAYDLSIHNRRAARPSTEGNDIGFRVVLMPE